MEICEVILKNVEEKNPKLTTDDSKTPSILAAENQHFEICRLIANHCGRNSFKVRERKVYEPVTVKNDFAGRANYKKIERKTLSPVQKTFLQEISVIMENIRKDMLTQTIKHEKIVYNVKPVPKLMEQTASESTSDSEPTVSHKVNKSVKMNNE